MNASEAERLIEQLSPLSVLDVGTPKWTAQDETIQRLNLQVFTMPCLREPCLRECVCLEQVRLGSTACVQLLV